MTDKLRQAAQQAVAILGPEAPLCSGSIEEWTEALRILRAALAEPQDPVAYNGWVLREVLFDNGEPVGHREPQQEPVLVVEKEPDYWSGGHFYKGDKPHINPTKVWGLSIGTKLYTAPQPAKREPLPPASPCALTEAEYRIFKLGWLECEAAHGIGSE